MTWILLFISLSVRFLVVGMLVFASNLAEQFPKSEFFRRINQVPFKIAALSVVIVVVLAAETLRNDIIRKNTKAQIEMEVQQHILDSISNNRVH